MEFMLRGDKREKGRREEESGNNTKRLPNQNGQAHLTLITLVRFWRNCQMGK